MLENECESFQSYRVHPYKIFISHAKEDNNISKLIADALKEKNFLPYIAERETIGEPLMTKLRDEMANSDAILIVGTENSDKKTACEIIGFETGMAWANHSKIFIIKSPKNRMTWFYGQLTDYIEFDFDQIDAHVGDILTSIKFENYVNPICFVFPRKNNNKKNSQNENCVSEDGSISLKSPFDDILYFVFGNYTNRIIRDIRITIRFPSQISINFDEGDLGLSIKREMFWMRAISSNIVRLAWPVLPSEEHWSAELRLHIQEIKNEINDSIEVTIQGGEYSKKVISIPITIASHG